MTWTTPVVPTCLGMPGCPSCPGPREDKTTDPCTGLTAVSALDTITGEAWEVAGIVLTSGGRDAPGLMWPGWMGGLEGEGWRGRGCCRSLMEGGRGSVGRRGGVREVEERGLKVTLPGDDWPREKLKVGGPLEAAGCVLVSTRTCFIPLLMPFRGVTVRRMGLSLALARTLRGTLIVCRI